MTRNRIAEKPIMALHPLRQRSVRRSRVSRDFFVCISGIDEEFVEDETVVNEVGADVWKVD